MATLPQNNFWRVNQSVHTPSLKWIKWLVFHIMVKKNCPQIKLTIPIIFPLQRDNITQFWYFSIACLNRLFKNSWVVCGLRWYDTQVMSLQWLKCKAATGLVLNKREPSTVYWCIASKLKAARNLYWMSNMFLWVEIFLFFVCYHVFPKRHSQL